MVKLDVHVQAEHVDGVLYIYSSSLLHKTSKVVAVDLGTHGRHTRLKKTICLTFLLRQIYPQNNVD